jgi:hypothetical protein
MPGTRRSAPPSGRPSVEARAAIALLGVDVHTAHRGVTMQGHDDPQDSTADDVGPRQAPGNDGWNEPSEEAPETLERAVRPADDDGPDVEGQKA